MRYQPQMHTKLAGAALILGLSLAACANDTNRGNDTGAKNRPATASTMHANANSRGAGVDADGTTRMNQQGMQQQLSEMPVGTLTTHEADGLLYMREEEKLAHDVYLALGERWTLPVFTNIASAEQTHTDAVQLLLERYNLTDPAAGNAAGVFTNAELQALYAKLVEQGSTSLTEALSVGAEIEELDIVDLRSRASDKADVDLVYSNLERGSRNHLRAFTKQLDRNGSTYEPMHLPTADYDAIVSGDIERGQ